MKMITKDDLIIALSRTKDEIFDLDSFDNLLELVGDDYFTVDGELIKTKENELMTKLRNKEI